MREASLYIMALIYVGAGILHFLRPGMYMGIMPPWLPAHKFLVLASGACEILFGLLLLPAGTRPVAAWLIIALLIAVFPANVQMALQFTEQHRPGWWLTWLRLPLQGVLIWWAYTFTR
ncbi:DoxX family protein [Adhaeribacter swui]|uniref:DoxX family protein n=1 Tax=Adhaeribacter swui TaxID=2086471 RepID=A0A7G7G345_9BACT|nr:DoxX family protein [Adhaeribacter swui]QNF31579.1 DoxX family protein [Adhaeribacter swui]